jgi:hypothetical protein
MVHVSSSEIKRWYQEGIEFFQHMNAENKPDIMCSTCSVALCKTACFSEYHTQKNYWTGTQKCNMILDIYPNTFSEKLSWNIICFGVKSDFILAAFVTCIF